MDKVKELKTDCTLWIQRLKHKFIRHVYNKMVTKQINLKNRSYYFWNDQIWINNLDAKNLKLGKKSVMDINIYYIGYVTKKPEYNINSVNPL